MGVGYLITCMTLIWANKNFVFRIVKRLTLQRA